MPVKLSYINARGEEVILDDDENSFAHELVGRTGFEMPQIETETVEYGDGTQDIVISKMKPRTVTCYFWVDLDNKVEFERKLRKVKAKLMQVGSRMGEWGKLKIRQQNGEYVYLNCIYKSGFDALVRDSNVRLKFSLSFEATDPLFYNVFDNNDVFTASEESRYLMMEESLYMQPLTDSSHDDYSHNETAVYFESADTTTTHQLEIDCQKVYPTIKVTGSGTNISLYNALTGKKIALSSDVTVTSSKYLLIETKPLQRKVVLKSTSGSETSVLQYLSADSTLDWYLDNGINKITYKNSEVTADSRCTFTYTERWLSAD